MNVAPKPLIADRVSAIHFVFDVVLDSDWSPAMHRMEIVDDAVGPSLDRQRRVETYGGAILDNCRVFASFGTNADHGRNPRCGEPIGQQCRRGLPNSEA